jgi:hypothetical protein
VAEAVLQLLMEADAEGLIGAGRHERSPEQLNKGRSIRRKDGEPFLDGGGWDVGLAHASA